MSQELNLGELAEGNVNFSFISKDITWKVQNVLSFPSDILTKLKSPVFSFANGTWNFVMDIERERYKQRKVVFSIRKLASNETAQSVYFRFFLSTTSGKGIMSFAAGHIFSSADVICKAKELPDLTFERDIAPEGTLVVVCRMHSQKPKARLEILAKSTEEVAVQTDTLSPVQTDTSSPVQTDTSPPVQTNTTKLLDDLESLLLSEGGCDVTLHVNGQAFRAHRAILGARSSVFASMLGHNMKENNTGVVDIEDCDPEYFPDFLRFLYCGRTEIINSQNAYSLYRAADKYDVEDLKSECSTFIRGHLDVATFCDTITLALQHSETDLVNQATDFFAKNMLKIIVTVKWQVFLTENPIQGNELTIKALSADKNSNP